MTANRSSAPSFAGMPQPRWLALFLLLGGIGLVITSSALADDLDFNRDVRPILSDKCYFCHGPDEENNKAGLRLDTRDDAEDAIDSGELLERIQSDDPDYFMPPPESNLSLSDEEKQVLEQWLDAGAKYERHWAFELLPESVDVPTPKDAAWSRKTLDRFVRAKQEAAGVKPSRPAAPLRWLRRVTFDLTGLPPSLTEVQTFAAAIEQGNHESKDAIEDVFSAVVDRLLKSPAFGEHMAVAWLDSARYADSYGYQSDKLNTQWPYRDWVVSAFNKNLPYDDFLTWQLAGDLLDNPTTEQKLATAFNRIHRLNNEGGAVFEEWRLENVADRVHTFGTAVLGLTLECCRCHDHKYDPIPMRDYYAMSAFFNSIDESGVYDRHEKVPCPSLLLPTKSQQEKLAAIVKMVAAIERKHEKAVLAAAAKWNKLTDKKKKATTKIPDLRLALTFDRKFDKRLKEVYHPSEGDRAWAKMVPLVEVKDCDIARLAHKHDDAAEKKGEPLPRLALQLDGERGITAEGITPFDRWTPFSVVVTLRETQRSPERSLIAHHTRGTDCGYNGWDLTIVDGHLESRLCRVWPGNAIGVRTVEPIAADQWHQIAATYDGSSNAAGLKLLLNGQPLETTVLRDQLKKSANVKVDHGGQFVIGQRFRARGLAGGLIDDVRVYERALTQAEVKHLATGEPLVPNADYFASAVDSKSRRTLSELTAARKSLVLAEEVIDEIPVMKELATPRPAHVLHRGEYDAPKNDQTRVERDVLSKLPLPLPDDAQRDRLGLANWVTHPRHPLTARVAVNRFWGSFFAHGLIRTPENFGLQGDLPTHPQLLDWLARDFIKHGWDVKRLCRDIVLSATYRQDSAATPEKLETDPTNRLLARGPAYRLAAEQIRDLALTASGLMNRTMGGPPVSPYQPGEDLWREANSMSPAYKQSVGQSLHRRSLYSVWKRTAPLPNMMAFDTSSREVCTVERSRTNTPLQALVLLNDVQFVEAARQLAVRVMGDQNELEEQIQAAFVTLAGREASDEEIATLNQLFHDEQKWFAENREDAVKLTSLGDTELPPNLDAAELAAMTTVCQTILNLDATIWRR